ncbi:MAG: hypothetical protein NZ533_09185 [Casimicrobiaceae bacterium]|nr:hypothetical protein [Casimicrobiaceae bacterium]MDW8312196.1 hypothetical protein [Burkholderiales bacterium]
MTEAPVAARPEPALPSPAAGPNIALGRFALPGLARLNSADRLRAAALLLERELGVDPKRVRLAVEPIQGAAHDSKPPAEECLIAWTLDSSEPSATRLLGLATGDTIYWFGAPEGWAVGPGGLADCLSPASEDQPGLPVALGMLLAASPGARTLALVEPAASIRGNTAVQTVWAAASGLDVRELSPEAVPWGAPVLLQPPPPPRIRPRWSALDRALAALAVATGLLCLTTLLRGLWLPDSSALARDAKAAEQREASAAARGSAAGLLLLRALHSAPSLADALLGGDYADGRWVLRVRADVPAEPVVRALTNNGLAVQWLVEGDELRLRIERP